MRIATAALAAALTLSACANSYESRIRSSLMDAGLSRSLSDCMAERMVDRLSDRQLQSLARLTGLGGRDIRDMRVQDFLLRARSILDPDVYEVVTRAGLGCAISG